MIVHEGPATITRGSAVLPLRIARTSDKGLATIHCSSNLLKLKKFRVGQNHLYGSARFVGRMAMMAAEVRAPRPSLPFA